MNNLTIKWTALRSLLQGATLLTLWALISACSGSENTVSQNHGAADSNDNGVINLLFIGHTHREGEGGFHLSHLNASLFNQALGPAKIFMEYVESLDRLGAEREALLERYVENGGAFLPIHSASACFECSPKYTKLVGARFVSHGEGVFNTTVAPGQESHPIMDGFEMFETWDETYVHADHNDEGRTVLMYREDEPWTWVREQGKGRGFYTAYGHDQRTWGQPEFHDLLIRGILWAVGDAKRNANRALVSTLPEGTYRDAGTIPNYRRVEPAPQFQEAFSVEDSMALTMVPPGFELQLFVSEPDIVNPVAFTWDEAGRLFVIESVDYPHDLVVDGEGNDRITMCEDTDGDGRADRCEVFAEGLSIPTGIMPLNGGFVVAQAPHFLFLKDTDGDGKAD